MAISFSSLGNPAPIGNLLIVDGLNIAFRWKHQGVLDFKYDYARTVESLAKSYNAGTIKLLPMAVVVIEKLYYPNTRQTVKKNTQNRLLKKRKSLQCLWQSLVIHLLC